MRIDMARFLGVVAVAGAVTVAGCRQGEPGAPGVGERTGAALDRAAEKSAEVTTNVVEKTGEAAKAAAAATKDFTGEVLEKTGEGLEKAGAAVEKTGAGMQE